jgi:hypothetical protein
MRQNSRISDALRAFFSEAATSRRGVDFNIFVPNQLCRMIRLTCPASPTSRAAWFIAHSCTFATPHPPRRSAPWRRLGVALGLVRPVVAAHRLDRFRCGSRCSAREAVPSGGKGWQSPVRWLAIDRLLRIEAWEPNPLERHHPRCPVETNEHPRSEMERKSLSQRAMGFEPTTSSLGSWHSTTELRPQTRFFST